MIISSCNKSINFRWRTSFSLQGTSKPPPSPRLHLHPDVFFLPSNKNHFSGKIILFLQIYWMLLSLNVPQLFRIFVYKQRICLLGCLVLFTPQNFREIQGSICLCMCGDLWHTCRFDFQADGEKNIVRDWENVRNVTNEVATLFHLKPSFTQKIDFCHPLLSRCGLSKHPI